MRATPFRNGLLLVALFLGQWLVFAHAQQHSPLEPERVCQICLHAQGLDSGALASTLPTLHLPVVHVVSTPQVETQTVAVTTAHYPIRGPPSLLA